MGSKAATPRRRPLGLGGQLRSDRSHIDQFNAAPGGIAGTRGASGQGSGGGLSLTRLPVVTLSKSSKVVFNFSSTTDDDISGTYTVSSTKVVHDESWRAVTNETTAAGRPGRPP